MLSGTLDHGWAFSYLRTFSRRTTLTLIWNRLRGALLQAKPAGKGPVVKTKAKKFTLDLSVCVDDKIIDPADFVSLASPREAVL